MARWSRGMIFASGARGPGSTDDQLSFRKNLEAWIKPTQSKLEILHKATAFISTASKKNRHKDTAVSVFFEVTHWGYGI